MEIVHGVPQTAWYPVINTDTLYVGQLVKAKNEGVEPVAQASGIADSLYRKRTTAILAEGSTSNNIIFGLVIGTSNKTPSFSTTYNAEQITYASPNAAGVNTNTYTGVGGPWAKGDNIAYVKVAILDPTITLRSHLYQSSSVVGTAPTVGTVTASTSGQTVTTATVGVVGVASQSTLYFRSGNAAGAYRVTDDTSATVHTWDIPLSSTAASAQVGDTIVKVNLRPVGQCRAQLSNEALWINSGASVTTNYFSVNVTRLDLSTAGKEYVDFKIDPIHYSIGVQATS
jgi:hypothetical protein